MAFKGEEEQRRSTRGFAAKPMARLARPDNQRYTCNRDMAYSMKIYTKTGDRRKLPASSERFRGKEAVRIERYGSVES